MKPIALGSLLVGLAATLAVAQDRPRFVTAKLLPPTEPNLIERVQAPGAWSLAISETTRVVAVGFAPGSSHHLALFRLDDGGRVVTSTPPLLVRLPKPASVAVFTNFVAALVAHPTRPLLYVLQDLYAWLQPPMDNPKTDPVLAEMDRLFVYRLDPTNLTAELVATIRSEYFAHSVHPEPAMGSALALDPTKRRLYLPSLRDPAVTNAVSPGVGYLQLDDDGLPVVKEGKIAPPVFRSVYGSWARVGLGWMFPTPDTVVFGMISGYVTWNQADRRAPITIKTEGHPYEWGACFTGHPTQPILYRSAPVVVPLVQAIELADGYPTLLPQEINVAGGRNPQVLEKRHQLLIGRPGEVVLINLDPHGWFTGDVVTNAAPDFSGQAVAYSPGFDRIYVAGGKAP